MVFDDLLIENLSFMDFFEHGLQLLLVLQVLLTFDLFEGGFFVAELHYDSFELGTLLLDLILKFVIFCPELTHLLVG